MLTRPCICRAFRWFVDIAIIANAVCIAILFDKLESMFLVIFNLEIVLKVYALGPMNFIRSNWNRSFSFLGFGEGFGVLRSYVLVSRC